MTKVLLFFTLLFSFLNLNAQTTSIPDVNFEKKLILLGIDKNGENGNILNSDAQAVTTLTLSGTGITNLSGLQAFVNVVTLDLGSNQFTTAPLTNLTALESLIFSGNDLISVLDVSQNVALKILKLQSNTSVAGDAPLTSLNLANNSNLQELELNRFGNLSNLTLPVTATLTKIRITFLADPTLNFAVCSGLKDLYIQESKVNTVITLPNVFTVLEKLDFSDIKIPTIDLSNYINLKDLRLTTTYVENLILPNSTTLEKIYILIHDLQGLQNFASLPNLKDLTVQSNQTTPLTVNISQNLLLEKLDLSRNDMSIINLTQNVALLELFLEGNLFTNINIVKNVNLENLYLNANLLPSINVSQNILLENFRISNNLLPSLDVTQNINLWGLDIGNNLFTGSGLDLTGNPLLRYLRASFNKISSLNIVQNPKMNSLILDHNLFTGTDIIQQYYNIRAANLGIGSSQYFDVSFNQLSGTIPNIVGLMNIGNNGIGATTNYYSLIFNDNNFQFGDFEAQHLTMISYLPLQNEWGNDIVRKYSYAPQAKVNLVETPTITAGSDITLTTTVSGAQNHYKWFKNDVAIVGAPDSPNYVITSANPCDSGVYHCEIRSDLVPFENANPPGTDGKNLLLIRNDITLTVRPVANTCSSLVFPVNLATNVGVNTSITWSDSPNACGYKLNVGTTSGGTQILNNFDVGDVNTYQFTTNLPSNREIFIKIIPYFANGTTQNCPIQSFTTNSTVLAVPACVTAMNYPKINTLVDVNQNFSWIPVANATGYTVTMGTTPGGSQIAGSTNLVTNVFNPTGDLPQGVPIYLTIIPFNADGNAVGCNVFQFSVETIPNPPTCPVSYSIANGATNVSINLGGISWPSVSSQTIYNVSIGTTPGGTQYENYFFNNISNYYSVPTPFAYGTTYYLTITVEDQSTGNTTLCSSLVFTTEPQPIPDCANSIMPANNSVNVPLASNITWNAIPSATGYRISIGTTAGGTQFLNNFDNGNSTTYNPPVNFAPNTIYYVRIRPYNVAGNATGCSEFRFATISTIPTCTTNISPANNATSVLVSANISWNASPTATGYFISIGTTSGATDFLNNFDNGNSVTYNPTTDFLPNTTYFVTITPYNSAGNATACISSEFTTETVAILIPTCTTLTLPTNNASNVPVNTNISWNTSTTATGYFISIGVASGGTDFLNNFDNGNSVTYNPTTDFLPNTTYFVTITPYNSVGNATACSSSDFITEFKNVNSLVIPNYFTPNGDGNNDFWSIQDTNNEIEGISIFDRFGRLLKYSKANSLWDGTFNNEQLPSTDYWFLIVLKNGENLNGHFSLKR